MERFDRPARNFWVQPVPRLEGIPVGAPTPVHWMVRGQLEGDGLNLPVGTGKRAEAAWRRVADAGPDRVAVVFGHARREGLGGAVVIVAGLPHRVDGDNPGGPEPVEQGD